MVAKLEGVEGKKPFPWQNVSYPKSLRIPEGRNLPALMCEERFCLDSWLSLWFHLVPSLLRHICHWPRHCQRWNRRYRGARTKWGLVNCICIIGWQFYVAMTQPRPCHPEIILHTFIQSIVILLFFSLQIISPLYMHRERERADWLLHKQRYSRAKSSIIYWFKSE